jgi:Ca2+-binding EF-hand superfamily protein
MERRRWIGVTWAVAAVFALAAIVGTVAFAQRASVPKAQDKIALAQPEVRQLLLLMDTDKNGKISKQEWMSFMEAEFNRLDKDHSGDLDAKDLEESRLRVSRPFAAAGK